MHRIDDPYLNPFEHLSEIEKAAFWVDEMFNHTSIIENISASLGELINAENQLPWEHDSALSSHSLERLGQSICSYMDAPIVLGSISTLLENLSDTIQLEPQSLFALDFIETVESLNNCPFSALIETLHNRLSDYGATVSSFMSSVDFSAGLDDNLAKHLSTAIFDGVRIEDNDVYLSSDVYKSFSKITKSEPHTAQITETGEHKIAFGEFFYKWIFPIILAIVPMVYDGLKDHLQALEAQNSAISDELYKEQILQLQKDENICMQAILNAIISFQESVDDLQESVDDLQESVDDLQESVDDLQESVDDLQESQQSPDRSALGFQNTCQTPEDCIPSPADMFPEDFESSGKTYDSESID